MLRLLREQHGVVLHLGGRCAGGEVGAYHAEDEHGRRLIVKWTDDPADAGRLELVVHRVNGLRARGYPVPEYLGAWAVDGAAVVVQEAIPGRWCDDVTHALVDQVLVIGPLQSGAADGSGGWADYMRRTLTEGAQGYCLHEPLRVHSPETRRLLDWVESVGRDVGRLPEGDLVHVDFHHRNMLREDGLLTAVVDWEGCRPGDRAFDLVTFCFGMTDAVQEAGVEERVWAAACDLAGIERLAPYVAHMALRRVDWSIRHHPDEVDRVLGLAFRYAGHVGMPAPGAT